MPRTTGPTKVAVVGVGYMGHNHARIYKQLADADLVAVADIDTGRATAAAATFGCSSYRTAADLLRQHPDLDAVSIAVPTSQHLTVAREVLAEGLPCLIEKPLTPTSSEGRQLIDLAALSNAIVQVGHIERYNPAIMALSSLSLKPLFIKSDRVSPMPFRSLDVDVVFDVMIHDIDLVLALTGEQGQEARIEALGVDINSELVHLANARLTLPSGCLADLTASRIALSSKRHLRIFTADAYISIDCERKRATLLRLEDYLYGLEKARKHSEEGQEVSETDLFRLVKVHDLVATQHWERDYQLRAELIDFISAVRQKRNPPTVDLWAGLRAVELAERITSAMQRVEVSAQSSVPHI